MDFERAEYEGASPSAARCVGCGQALAEQYWTVGAGMLCERCAEQVKAGPPKGGGLLRFVGAFGAGLGVGLLGALGYGLIIHFTGYQLALVTIGIGWAIGRAILWATGGRGGTVYQVMGVLLTYACCLWAFVPDVVQELTRQGTEVFVAAIIAPFLALTIPFSGGMDVLSVAILAFGLWEGWKQPRAVPVVVQGPFALSEREPEPEPQPAAAEAPSAGPAPAAEGPAGSP